MIYWIIWFIVIIAWLGFGILAYGGIKAWIVRDGYTWDRDDHEYGIIFIWFGPFAFCVALICTGFFYNGFVWRTTK